jgi:diadenosine tetraphosphate (Ap4A) HIT family hydrolase
MEDIARVAHAIRKVCKPTKLNYEILGNVVPHVHIHIIARYEGDPVWDRAAWFALPDTESLSEDEYASLADALRAETSA